MGWNKRISKIRKQVILMNLIKDLAVSRTMLWKLAKNDFKTKYAGSYLGIFWAFVQPIITVAIYVFVFQVGFKAAPADNGYPFVLYLIAGIIPWFFFAEALMNATNCLMEYSYLVKKVVFNISILPVLKIISSLFVHLFFIVLSYIIFCVNGKVPNIHIIQLLYYTFSTIALVTAISYLTCAITPFFKDFGQIVNIVTQIGMWMTPIMWSENMIEEKFRWILKINPVYYIVTGYRDCYINGVWFWQRYKLTIYFWIVTIVLFAIGVRVFKKLKIHFSDVL
ncbi:MAG: ABC transporter permease [Lachnospiraceae bacterium]|nr:ABC transporter permease [Lachnospiraceae bacterium]